MILDILLSLAPALLETAATQALTPLAPQNKTPMIYNTAPVSPASFAERFPATDSLCSFRANGFAIRLWYIGVLPSGRQALAFQVRKAGRVVFQGEYFQASPQANCDAVKMQLRLAADVMGFLSEVEGYENDAYDASADLEARSDRTPEGAR